MHLQPQRGSRTLPGLTLAPITTESPGRPSMHFCASLPWTPAPGRGREDPQTPGAEAGWEMYPVGRGTQCPSQDSGSQRAPGGQRAEPGAPPFFSFCLFSQVATLGAFLFFFLTFIY